MMSLTIQKSPRRPEIILEDAKDIIFPKRKKNNEDDEQKNKKNDVIHTKPIRTHEKESMVLVAGTIKTVTSYMDKKSGQNDPTTRSASYNITHTFVDAWTRNLIPDHPGISSYYSTYISSIFNKFDELYQTNGTGTFYDFIVGMTQANSFISFMRQLTINDLTDDDPNRPKCSCGLSYSCTNFDRKCNAASESFCPCTCTQGMCIACIAFGYIGSMLNCLRSYVNLLKDRLKTVTPLEICELIGGDFANKCTIKCTTCFGSICFCNACASAESDLTMRKHVITLNSNDRFEIIEKSKIITYSDLPLQAETKMIEGLMPATETQLQSFQYDMTRLENDTRAINIYELQIELVRLNEQVRSLNEIIELKNREIAKSDEIISIMKNCTVSYESVTNAVNDTQRTICDVVSGLRDTESDLSKSLSKLADGMGSRFSDGTGAYARSNDVIFASDYAYTSTIEGTNIEVQGPVIKPEKDKRKCAFCNVFGHNRRNGDDKNERFCPAKKVLSWKGDSIAALAEAKLKAKDFTGLENLIKNARMEYQAARLAGANLPDAEARFAQIEQIRQLERMTQM
jgi:hypothetical protein